MDYYLSKQIGNPAGANDQAGMQSMIDRPVLIEESRLFGQELIRDIMGKYLKCYQAQVDRIEEYANKALFRELETAAHRFASSVSCFYADPVFKAADDLEKMAHAHRTEGLDAAFGCLKQLAGLLATELEQILPELQD
jgi:hypothetical protein